MRKLFPIAALATLAIAPLAHAAPQGGPDDRGPPPPHMGHGPMRPPIGLGILSGITLTDSQKEKIATIFKENRPEAPPHDDAHRRLEDLLSGSKTPDADDVQALETEMAHQDEERIKHEVDIALKIRAVLTPDQIEQAQDNRKEMHELGKKMHNLMKIDMPRPDHGPGHGPEHGPKHGPDGEPGPGPEDGPDGGPR